jgi:hypothetical protein
VKNRRSSAWFQVTRSPRIAIITLQEVKSLGRLTSVLAMCAGSGELVLAPTVKKLSRIPIGCRGVVYGDFGPPISAVDLGIRLSSSHLSGARTMKELGRSLCSSKLRCRRRSWATSQLRLVADLQLLQLGRTFSSAARCSAHNVNKEVDCFTLPDGYAADGTAAASRHVTLRELTQQRFRA